MANDDKINFIAGRFSSMTADNLDLWYNKKLNKFFVRNSSDVQWLDSEEVPIFNDQGEIINAKFDKKTRSGFEITEEDFIKTELRFISDGIQVDNLNLDKKKVIQSYQQFLKEKQQGLKVLRQDPETTEDHPEHDPNLWSAECYELFKYLFENYYNGKTKRQLMNIWFFLHEYDPLQYTLKATKEKYIAFLWEKYGIKIKNTIKAKYKYDTKEFPTMNDHRINYENLLFSN